MVGHIYRRRRSGKVFYGFHVNYKQQKGWMFQFVDNESAVASHKRLTLIEEKTQLIFVFLKTHLEYSEMEPNLKILAKLIGGAWTPDKLHHYFKILFLLSGQEGMDWFLYITMCSLALGRDIRQEKPPVIRRLEEQFAYLEERLEQNGRWPELAFVQVARDTGFRMCELDFLEWEDVQNPRIMLRLPGKRESPVMSGIIREKTYATLQKLEHTSLKVFDYQGEHFWGIISRTQGLSFKSLDYRYCYQLKVMWQEIIIPADPDSGGSVYAGNDSGMA